MSTELRSNIPAGGRNHLDAPCPKCGGRLASCEAGNVPGAVACGCGWQGEHCGMERDWEIDSGHAVAIFRQHLGRPWGAREGLVRVRCDIADKGRWTMAARREGKTLSDWLRGIANSAS
jgi:hypothetical protein